MKESIKKKKGGCMMAFPEMISSGVLPFLTEMIIEEDNETVGKFYKELTNEERRFIFKRESVPLNDIMKLEKSVRAKLERSRIKSKNSI